MTNTGITRPVDELGRIVLPMELRRLMNIQVKDLLEIHTDGNSIILRKFEKSCVFCGCSDDLVGLFEKLICNQCIQKMNQELHSQKKLVAIRKRE